MRCGIRLPPLTLSRSCPRSDLMSPLPRRRHRPVRGALGVAIAIPGRALPSRGDPRHSLREAHCNHLSALLGVGSAHEGQGDAGHVYKGPEEHQQCEHAKLGPLKRLLGITAPKIAVHHQYGKQSRLPQRTWSLSQILSPQTHGRGIPVRRGKAPDCLMNGSVLHRIRYAGRSGQIAYTPSAPSPARPRRARWLSSTP